MRFQKYLVGCGLALALVACGGGGGNPGISLSGSVTATGTDAETGTTALPTLRLALSGGGSSVTASGSSVAQASVKDAAGAAVVGKLVTFSADTALVKFSPSSGQVLTDPNGVASIQISPASLAASGAGTLTANATVSGATVSNTFDFQLAAANLGLSNLNVGTGNLTAYGNRAVSVLATVDGTAATNTPVQVTFNASCGTVTPSVVTTDATGTANSTYTATLATCAGTNVTITAAAVGAPTATGTIAVAGSIATNVQFISTTPQLIYLKDTVGSTQAQVVFKVVDSSGNPLQNKKLSLALSNTATGVSLDTVGNGTPVIYTSDSFGLVSAAVFSGTVPTSLNVRATLLDVADAPTPVFSDSNLLTVASGRPTQKSLSLSVEKLSIEAANVDGQTTTVTLSMADRQGNPVPPGTQVNFVTETGVILPAVCFVPPVIPATDSSPAIPVSSCTVSLRSSGTRSLAGLVSILAYVSGEEDFVDVNGNNFYDAGDTFVGSDLGRAFRDDYGQSPSGRNGIYDTGEFQVPRDGVPACTASIGCVGDGAWGVADVREQAVVVFASSTATITSGSLLANVNVPGSSPATNALTDVVVTIGDINGNSMPTGSKVEIRTLDNQINVPGLIGAQCTLSSSSSFTLANSLSAFSTNLSLNFCTVGDKFSVKVTSPLGTVTERIFSVQ